MTGNVYHVTGNDRKPEINKPDIGENEKVATNDENKHRMMQNMAQLWLQQEVCQDCFICVTQVLDFV